MIFFLRTQTLPSESFTIVICGPVILIFPDLSQVVYARAHV